MLCTVLTASRSRALSEGLTYDCGDLDVKPGMLVRVPLRGQTVEGIVLETDVAALEGTIKTKTISQIESSDPLLTDSQMKTMAWMAQYYWCNLRQAAAVFLPPLPWRNLLPKAERWIRLVKKADVRGAKQKIVVNLLAHGQWTPEDMVIDETGTSDAVLRALLKSGVIEREERREKKESTDPYIESGSLPPLSELQKSVIADVRISKKPSLIFGVTGSGKTEIYAHLAAEQMKQGKQSILLVPEILLSQELLRRFELLLGKDQIAIIHSRLSVSQRRQEWQRIARGEVAMVIGSRSALFAPCRKLGLVVIDEEHEWTYKNEQTPRYHARETAETLCRESGAKLVLGSATPSLDSWKHAKDGDYTLIRLPERFNNQSLPTVTVIDLGTVRFGKHYPFSPPLIAAIDDRLKKKEQCVLFLNRRGMATSVLCLECRAQILSKESGLPLTLHRRHDGAPILVDHIAGLTQDMPEKCPSCGSARLLPVGAGTQKLEESLSMLFPSAKVLRADSDVLKRPEEIRELLASMRERRADILLGTQSVVKGLDLPEVTLAAVLLADVGMSLPHFRAGERVFQLLTQLTGRSGRSKPGEVIIQTFRPESAEVKFASGHKTEDFLNTEMSLREQHGYPPATTMIRLTLSNSDAMKKAKSLADIAGNSSGVTAFAAPTFFGAGKIWHVLLRGNRDLHPVLSTLPLDGVTVDIDPVDCL